MGNGHEREGEVKDNGNFWLGYLMVILPINKGHIGGGAGMYVPAVGAKMSSNVKGYRYFHSKPFSHKQICLRPFPCIMNWLQKIKEQKIKEGHYKEHNEIYCNNENAST